MEKFFPSREGKKEDIVLGAIAGDIIGSVYEGRPMKGKDFPLFLPESHFTDDTVLTVAVAKAVMEDRDYRRWLWAIGRQYMGVGYGASFRRWLQAHDPKPYNSWGNGAAMRVSPIGFAFDDIDTVLIEARRSAEVSHNHPEGIKGAQATALVVFLARTTHDKDRIREEVTRRFGYHLFPIEEIRPHYSFDVSCQATVPAAISAFLDSYSYEEAIRNAISLGGDADTLACIAGGFAEAYYGPVAPYIVEELKRRLPEDLWQITVRFWQKYVLARFASP